MLPRRVSLLSTIVVAWASGCAPQSTPDDPTGVVLGISQNSTTPSTPQNTTPTSGGTSNGASATPSSPAADNQTISGRLTGSAAVRLFDLGASAAGDEWVVSDVGTGLTSSAFVLVLFDENDDMLMRQVVVPGAPLRHVMRAATNNARLGLTPLPGSGGGDFRFQIARNAAQAIPAAHAQVVWLNFGAGSDVRIQHRAGVSFTAFDGAKLGSSYAGTTQRIKSSIVSAMRADYTAYQMEIRTSDEGPPPSGAYSTVYFGGYDPSLLGLADTVDSYNQADGQSAIVYVDTFALYETMQLTPEQMGLMIANVASHELGHLLGLYHTRDPNDLMDTTGTAWDLAEDQAFSRALLEQSVFPSGYENCPTLLTQTLGLRSDATKRLATSRAAKTPMHALIRRLTDLELHYACGSCSAINDLPR